MPNAAKLVSALCLAILAFIVSGLIMPLFPEGTDFGYFVLVNVVIGAATGWSVIGKRAGRGWTSAINVGLTGAVMLVFWGLFVQGCYEMVDLAMRRRYDNAFEALVAIFEIMAEYALLIATVPIGIALAIGGAAAGILAEIAARRWN